MNEVPGRGPSNRPGLNSPRRSITHENPTVSTIATAKPTNSAFSERRAGPTRRWTAATQSPASGPNSGPTAIAPTIRIALSSTAPHAASMVATDMNARYTAVSVDSSWVISATASHTSASAPSPGASSSAWSAAFDRTSSTCCALIAPCSASPSARNPLNTSSAASRATSQDITSPAGDSAAPGSTTTWVTPTQPSRRASTVSRRSAGTISRRCSTTAPYDVTAVRRPVPARADRSVADRVTDDHLPY